MQPLVLTELAEVHWYPMQHSAKELAALSFSCKDRSGQHQNISAMPGCGRAFGSMLRIEAQWDSLLLLSEATGSCLSGDGRRSKLRDLLQRPGLCGDLDGLTFYNLECGPFQWIEKVGGRLKGHVAGSRIAAAEKRAVKRRPERL